MHLYHLLVPFGDMSFAMSSVLCNHLVAPTVQWCITALQHWLQSKIRIRAPQQCAVCKVTSYLCTCTFDASCNAPVHLRCPVPDTHCTLVASKMHQSTATVPFVQCAMYYAQSTRHWALHRRCIGNRGHWCM